MEVVVVYELDDGLESLTWLLFELDEVLDFWKSLLFELVDALGSTKSLLDVDIRKEGMPAGPEETRVGVKSGSAYGLRVS